MLPRSSLLAERRNSDRSGTWTADRTETTAARRFSAPDDVLPRPPSSGAAPPRAARLAAALVAGLYLVAFCHPLTARFGTGLTFVAGAFAAATVGIARRCNRLAGSHGGIAMAIDRPLLGAGRLGDRLWMAGRPDQSLLPLDRSRRLRLAPGAIRGRFRRVACPGRSAGRLRGPT